MPSEKSHRVSLKKTVRNKAARSSAKSAVTEAKRALDSDSRNQASAAVARASSVLDVGVRKGVLHRNNAARRKSRLAKRLARMA